MLSINLTDKEEIRNFIYDSNNHKLLIGSRRMGKTSALLLALARGCSDENNPRHSTFIMPTMNNVEQVYSILKQICDELNIKISQATKNGAFAFSCMIEKSRVVFTNSNDFLSGNKRGYKYRDTYVDEPNFLSNFNELLEEINYKTWNYPDAKILIAGSSNLNGINLKNLSANVEFSRHIILAKNYLSTVAINEMQQALSSEQFATEIECKFITRE